jgi:hypothetical protein
MCILHIGFNDVSVVQCFLKQYFFDKDVDPNNEHQPSEGLFKKENLRNMISIIFWTILFE